MEIFPFVTKEKYSKIQRSRILDLGQNFQRYAEHQNFQRSAEQHKTYQECVECYPPPQQNLQSSVGAL
jgi:hypothetical protein